VGIATLEGQELFLEMQATCSDYRETKRLIYFEIRQLSQELRFEFDALKAAIGSGSIVALARWISTQD